MFELSFGEILVVVLVGLVVLGPEELPVVARSVRRMWRSLHQTTHDIQQQVMQIIDDPEMEEPLKPVSLIRGDDGTYYEAYDVSELAHYRTPPSTHDTTKESPHE
ncbi:MAG: hypothetical protein EAZ74_05935 [Alphaproteobacteria bacterium]|nr:MAG: hypothetical protein EAZ74_05935 [Alphaproteobacteria bacterium]TAF38505.1 MAG: hypothetical protein EAZ66_06225 [Alphaproteobacteria bacterium]TAF75471.1 MAG: hypothetical protein EAZ52_06490 [Alphaproteobacteria bacterium]